MLLPRKAQSHTSAEAALEALTIVRARTQALIAPISDRDLELSHSPIMSPLVWDLGHIAAYEDLWISHLSSGRPLLRPDLAHVDDAFETPRSQRSRMRLLSREECEVYLRAVRSRTVEVIERGGVGDGALMEMVLRHEYQHNETMLQTIQLARRRDVGAETARVIRDTVATLPELARAVITLRDMVGCTPLETCNTLGLTGTNHRVLLHRARTKVRAAVEAAFDMEMTA